VRFLPNTAYIATVVGDFVLTDNSQLPKSMIVHRNHHPIAL